MRGLAVLGLLLVFGPGCKDSSKPGASPGGQIEPASPRAPGAPGQPATAGPRAAVAHLTSPDGKIRGRVNLEEVAGRVQIKAEVAGLPAGEHGFHIHAGTACEPPDFKSAGDHFNPGGHAHGGPESAVRHAGDLGNLKATGELTSHRVTSDRITLGTGPSSVVGKTVIIHGAPDDLKTQPAGNAGPRIACGVIQAQGH